MKKFEIIVQNPEYDYLTKKILTDELHSIFPKMIFEVKTIPQKKTPSVERRIYLKKDRDRA